jgi:hypothetical protein
VSVAGHPKGAETEIDIMNTAELARKDLRDSETLNVIFHGLWAYVFHATGIRALTPSIDEHVLKAGTYGTELRLKEGKTYVLEGVNPAAQAPAIDATSNVVLTGLTRVDLTKLFCSIDLPFPDQMIPFRFLNNPVFNGSTANLLQATKVPDVQVLTYRFDDVKKLTLGRNLSWEPYFQAQTRTVNLHIFAQPETSVGASDHLNMAGGELVGMFPEVDLQPLHADPPDLPTDPGIRGVNKDDVKTLQERGINLPAGFNIVAKGSLVAAAAVAGNPHAGMTAIGAGAPSPRAAGNQVPLIRSGAPLPGWSAVIELESCLSIMVMLNSTV